MFMNAYIFLKEPLDKVLKVSCGGAVSVENFLVPTTPSTTKNTNIDDDDDDDDDDTHNHNHKVNHWNLDNCKNRQLLQRRQRNNNRQPQQNRRQGNNK